jgi:hypothetical protein
MNFYVAVNHVYFNLLSFISFSTRVHILHTAYNFRNPKKSYFYSGGNKQQTGFRECFLSFGARSFVFQFANQKYKD